MVTHDSGVNCLNGFLGAHGRGPLKIMALKRKTYTEAKMTAPLKRFQPLARGKPIARQGKPATGSIKRKRRSSGVKIDAADRYFSLYIRFRDNWTCQRCLTPYEVGSQGLHASHFWSRGRESTRFDPENVSAHCFGCHTELGGNPELHRAWKLKQIGQKRYDILMVRAETRAKKDRKLAALICKKLYEEEKSRFEQQ